MSNENRNICYGVALLCLLIGATFLAHWHGQKLRAERIEMRKAK
jgi:hypothetical protein